MYASGFTSAPKACGSSTSSLYVASRFGRNRSTSSWSGTSTASATFAASACSSGAIDPSHVLVAMGLDLDIALSSVLTYRKRAYEKLGIASQNELFAIALRLMTTPRPLN